MIQPSSITYFYTLLDEGSNSTHLKALTSEHELSGLSCGNTLNICQNVLQLHKLGFVDSQKGNTVEAFKGSIYLRVLPPFKRRPKLQNMFGICK